MSIMSRMKKTQVFDQASGYDGSGRPLKSAGTYEDEPCLEIDMSISTKSQNNNVNDVRYSEVTHVGLTTSKELKKGQKVVQGDRILIIHLQPINSTRLTQVYLKEVLEDDE